MPNPDAPWLDDPVVEASGDDAPWLSDPVADPNVIQRPEAAENFGLDRASGISATPWYAQGIFGGRGPSVLDVVDTLPAVGGAVGGIAALASALPSGGLGAAAVPMAAGVVGAGGEAARQHIRRAIGANAPQTPGEAAERIGREGTTQMVAEGVGGVVARPIASAVRSTFAPFAGSVDNAVTAAAARQGVEMPAAARTTSRVVPTMEALAAKGIGGGEAAERYTRASNALLAQAEHTVARASSLADDSARGKAIADGLDTFRRNWTKEKNALYAQAALPDNGIRLQARETVALLDSILAGKHSAGKILRTGPIADDSFYTGLYNGLTRTVRGPNGQTVRVLRDVEAKDLLAAHKELTQKIKASFADPFSAANAGALKKISATMQGEMDTAIRGANPALAARLDRANAVYAEGLTKINSTFGKDIHRLAKAGQYDQIAQRVANGRTSVDDIPRIMEVAGPQGTEAMRAAVLADLLGRAKNAQGALTPQGLGRAVQRFGDDRLAALLTPEQFAKVQDLSTLSASLDRGRRVQEGSQTAFLARYGAGIPASIANLPATLAALLADTSYNRFISSRVGQRWLTTGYEPFTREGITRATTAAAHASTVPVIEDYPDGATR